MIALTIAVILLSVSVLGIVGYLRWDYTQSKAAGELMAAARLALAPPSWPIRPSVNRTLRRKVGPLIFRRVGRNR